MNRPNSATTKKQEILSYDIDRKRLESLLEVLYPPKDFDSGNIKVSRRLGYYVVEAPSELNDQQIECLRQ